MMVYKEKEANLVLEDSGEELGKEEAWASQDLRETQDSQDLLDHMENKECLVQRGTEAILENQEFLESLERMG